MKTKLKKLKKKHKEERIEQNKRYQKTVKINGIPGNQRCLRLYKGKEVEKVREVIIDERQNICDSCVNEWFCENKTPYGCKNYETIDDALNNLKLKEKIN